LLLPFLESLCLGALVLKIRQETPRTPFKIQNCRFQEARAHGMGTVDCIFHPRAAGHFVPLAAAGNPKRLGGHS
jgi:hypothetical protein